MDGATLAHDGVAGAAHNVAPHVDGARSGFELPGKAIVHAVKVCLRGFAQIEVGEKLPNTNRQITNQRVFDFAPSAHEACQSNAWNSVGEKEIQILLCRNFLNYLFHFHFPVTNFK
jgi:hypothetical protein